jgi:hypothetical protein
VLQPIYLHDKRAANGVLRVLEKIKPLIFKLLQESECSDCPSFEKKRFRVATGRIELICAETIFKIVVGNSSVVPDSGKKIAQANADIQEWQLELRQEQANSQLLCSINSYSICSNKNLARTTIVTSKRLSELVGRSSAIVQLSNCNEQEKRQYLLVYGVLH